MAPHSSTLAWKIPWTEEPGRLQSMGSQRVGHDWATSLWLSCIGEGNGQSTPVLLPGKSHGQRSLVGYSPWGHKELDTTELLHFHFHFVSGESTKDMNGPQISKDSHQPWKSSTWLYPLVLAMRKGRNPMFFIAIIGLLIVKLWDKFFRKMGQASSLDTGSMFSGTHGYKWT